MELFLKTPPRQEPLELDEVQSYLRLSSQEEDRFVVNLIASARAHVENLTGRALLKQQWQMTLKPPYPKSSPLVRRSEKRLSIQLPRPPLLEVDSVTIEGKSISFKQEQGKIILSPLFWDREVQVTYWAGYGEEPSSLPPDLKMAVLMTTRFFYDQQPMTMTLLNPFRVYRLL